MKFNHQKIIIPVGAGIILLSGVILATYQNNQTDKSTTQNTVLNKTEQKHTNSTSDNPLDKITVVETNKNGIIDLDFSYMDKNNSVSLNSSIESSFKPETNLVQATTEIANEPKEETKIINENVIFIPINSNSKSTLTPVPMSLQHGLLLKEELLNKATQERVNSLNSQKQMDEQFLKSFKTSNQSQDVIGTSELAMLKDMKKIEFKAIIDSMETILPTHPNKAQFEKTINDYKKYFASVDNAMVKGLTYGKLKQIDEQQTKALNQLLAIQQNYFDYHQSATNIEFSDQLHLNSVDDNIAPTVIQNSNQTPSNQARQQPREPVRSSSSGFK